MSIQTYRKRVIVVTRQMPDCRPVPSVVIEIPAHRHEDDIGIQDHWLNEKADEHIAEFKKKFTEFGEAQWWKDVLVVE